jgi:hypothetical protein
MRIQSDRTSPWGRRVWIPDGDFETTMDALRSKVPGSFVAGRGIDVDAILLGAFGVTPDFGDVDDACLGRTCFEPDGTFTVLVNRALSDESAFSAVARRRLRSTLAHECAHIAFHAVLHPVQTPSLFGEPHEPRAVMCRQEHVEAQGGQPPWWEYQANRGMSCLLLPREFLLPVLAEALRSRGFADMREVLRAGRAEVVLQDVTQVFDVSFEMLLYRVQELGFISKHVGQSGLTI